METFVEKLVTALRYEICSLQTLTRVTPLLSHMPPEPLSLEGLLQETVASRKRGEILHPFSVVILSLACFSIL